MPPGVANAKEIYGLSPLRISSYNPYIKNMKIRLEYYIVTTFERHLQTNNGFIDEVIYEGCGR